MNTRKITILLFFLQLAVTGIAQTVIPPAQLNGKTAFAVITDEVTFRNCKAELFKYRDMLEREGLPAYVIHHNWTAPEQIRELLVQLHREKNLEGTVLIGDIPIPMLRRAQHLTSAFKMDEERFSMRESSVPSDRFYDDFSLQFNLIKRDSANPQMFYYELAPGSPQYISCDIYSGRIKPLRNGADPYRQISDYLNKVVALRSEQNPLDQFVSYTGEGSYSNSLTAWRAEHQTISEQFPGVFDRKNNARYLRYSMWDYPKEQVAAQLCREDLDFMFFHEHGMPDRQYLSAIPPTWDMDNHIARIKYEMRSSLRRDKETGRNMAERMKQWQELYRIDSSWFAGAFAPEVMTEDSLQDVHMGIILEDVTRIAPNVRFVIFDACYNGDFREDDYIAGRYIFSKGKCVVTFANSVNVLQDKSANDLLGLLGFGTRIGLWAQYTNILESHIIGDPTFCFKPAVNGLNCNENIAHNDQVDYWLNVLNTSPYADMQNVALLKLFNNGYPDISGLLFSTFKSSSFAVVRYNCMFLLEKLNDAYFHQVLKLAITDNDEFIRRIAAHRMGRVGHPDFIPFLVDAYINDNLSARVVFNVVSSLQLFPWLEVEKVINEHFASSPFLDRKSARQQLADKVKGGIIVKMSRDMADRTLREKSRIADIAFLKNMNYHPGVDTFLSVLKDPSEPVAVRRAIAASLGWFTLSVHKDKIVNTCRELMPVTPALYDELQRTCSMLKGRR